MDITRLLKAWSDGEPLALEQLMPVVYSELHRIAARQMAGERSGHILQPSALINEAFVRLLDGAPVDWENRSQFFARIATLMRHVLIDVARAEMTKKRGERVRTLSIETVDAFAVSAGYSEFMLDLDNALTRLAQLSGRQARVVELRYFAGLGNREIASLLDVSEATVVREWRIARAWLYDALEADAGGSDHGC